MELAIEKLIANPLIHKTDATPEKILEVANSIESMFREQVIDPDDFYQVWNSFVGKESKLLHLYFISKFHRYIQLAVIEGERTIFITLLFAIVDAFGKSSDSRRLRTLFKKYAGETEKDAIIRNFLFSQEIPIKNLTSEELVTARPKSLWYHVFCEDKRGIPNYVCGSWCTYDKTKIHKYLNRVSDHLYSMRNSVIHRATVTLFLGEKTQFGGSTLIDSFYPVDETHVHSYESSNMTRDVLEKIILNCLWKELREISRTINPAHT